MNTPVVETSVGQLGPIFEIQLADLQPESTLDRPEQALEVSPGDLEPEQLANQEKHEKVLEGREAARYLRSQLPVPPAQSIDAQSLQMELSLLLPRDQYLPRRARKLAWQISKGRRLTSRWDYIFLSELTPAEQKLSEGEFLNLYPDHDKRPTKKGGRPRKYRTPAAERKGHAERQRRYRERKHLVTPDVTKTPSQLAER